MAKCGLRGAVASCGRGKGWLNYRCNRRSKLRWQFSLKQAGSTTRAWPVTHDVPDGRLAARAKAFRERNGLLNRADLAGRNVAVAKIEVNGKEGFIEKASLNGAHSEQLIEGRVLQLRAAGHDVKVKEIYSERIPCNANGCTAAINRSMPGAHVFFHTKNHGDRAASDLLRAYGL